MGLFRTIPSVYKNLAVELYLANRYSDEKVFDDNNLFGLKTETSRKHPIEIASLLKGGRRSADKSLGFLPLIVSKYGPETSQLCMDLLKNIADDDYTSMTVEAMNIILNVSFNKLVKTPKMVSLLTKIFQTKDIDDSNIAIQLIHLVKATKTKNPRIWKRFFPILSRGYQYGIATILDAFLEADTGLDEELRDYINKHSEAGYKNEQMDKVWFKYYGVDLFRPRESQIDTIKKVRHMKMKNQAQKTSEEYSSFDIGDIVEDGEGNILKLTSHKGKNLNGDDIWWAVNPKGYAVDISANNMIPYDPKTSLHQPKFKIGQVVRVKSGYHVGDEITISKYTPFEEYPYYSSMVGDEFKESQLEAIDTKPKYKEGDILEGHSNGVLTRFIIKHVGDTNYIYDVYKKHGITFTKTLDDYHYPISKIDTEGKKLVGNIHDDKDKPTSKLKVGDMLQSSDGTKTILIKQVTLNNYTYDAFNNGVLTTSDFSNPQHVVDDAIKNGYYVLVNKGVKSEGSMLKVGDIFKDSPPKEGQTYTIATYLVTKVTDKEYTYDIFENGNKVANGHTVAKKMIDDSIKNGWYVMVDDKEKDALGDNDFNTTTNKYKEGDLISVNMSEEGETTKFLITGVNPKTYSYDCIKNKEGGFKDDESFAGEFPIKDFEDQMEDFGATVQKASDKSNTQQTEDNNSAKFKAGDVFKEKDSQYPTYIFITSVDDEDYQYKYSFGDANHWGQAHFDSISDLEDRLNTYYDQITDTKEESPVSKEDLKPKYQKGQVFQHIKKTSGTVEIDDIVSNEFYIVNYIDENGDIINTEYKKIQEFDASMGQLVKKNIYTDEGINNSAITEKSKPKYSAGDTFISTDGKFKAIIKSFSSEINSYVIDSYALDEEAKTWNLYHTSYDSDVDEFEKGMGELIQKGEWYEDVKI